MTWQFAHLWKEGLKYQQFVAESNEHCGLWTGVYRIAQLPDWAIEAAAELPGKYRLVVISEDWCGDATNTVPILARWAEATPNIELRILRRDEHPEVMDQYLTNGSRSIPVVIVLTEGMEELGWWGPRPMALQEWVTGEYAVGRDKKSLYPEVRRWYAKDKGATTLREVLALMGGATHTPSVTS